MDNLVRCHIVDLNLCPICKTSVKDPLHLVLGCPEVEQVWSVHGWFNQAISSPLADLLIYCLDFFMYQKIIGLNCSFAWHGAFGIGETP